MEMPEHLCGLFLYFCNVDRDRYWSSRFFCGCFLGSYLFLGFNSDFLGFLRFWFGRFFFLDDIRMRFGWFLDNIRVSSNRDTGGIVKILVRFRGCTWCRNRWHRSNVFVFWYILVEQVVYNIINLIHYLPHQQNIGRTITLNKME